jgi:hypothetical protein
MTISIIPNERNKLLARVELMACVLQLPDGRVDLPSPAMPARSRSHLMARNWRGHLLSLQTWRRLPGFELLPVRLTPA